MRYIKVNNYILEEDVLKIIMDIKHNLFNGKLKDVVYMPGNDNIVVTCPVHAGGHESKPACNIYVGSRSDIAYGYMHCFVCDEQGPFEKFVAACFECSVETAKKWLIGHYGKLAYEIADIGEDIDLNKKHIKFRMDDSELVTYQTYCPYLLSRGISRETCEKFNVRYDPKFRQVIFPCYSIDGRLIMMPKRSIDTKTFYLDKEHGKPVYCLDYILKNDITRCMIVEGPFDCLTCYEYGIPAIATLGAPSEEQVAMINKSNIKFLYVAFDNDSAGRKFTEFIKKRLSSTIITVDIELPAGRKDVNELSTDEWEELIFKNNLPKL